MFLISLRYQRLALRSIASPENITYHSPTFANAAQSTTIEKVISYKKDSSKLIISNKGL